jgi:hypothetical protein
MKIDPKQMAKMISEDPDEVNPFDDTEDEFVSEDDYSLEIEEMDLFGEIIADYLNRAKRTPEDFTNGEALRVGLHAKFFDHVGRELDPHNNGYQPNDIVWDNNGGQGTLTLGLQYFEYTHPEWADTYGMGEGYVYFKNGVWKSTGYMD